VALGIATRDSRLLTPLYIAFATHAGLEGLTRSDRIAADELERRGSAVMSVPWSSPRDWTRFDAVVIRATWDYYKQPEDFLTWLERLEQERVALWNPARLASWNMQKGYLRDLERAGVAVVPTAWVFQSDAAESLAELVRARGWQDVVVKPAVSANADRTWRTRGNITEQDEREFAALVAADDVMVQPFVESLARDGEWSFMFLGGEFSHAVLKRPAAGDFRVQSIHGGTVSRANPRPEWVSQARAALEPVTGPWLYARVDGCIVDGRFVLMELEMLEPDLFFNLAPESAVRFADSLESRV
jgi:glutathione synthase/RimK-type ligase-like ATP-grasp enzyme